MLKFRKTPTCLADVVHQVISDLDLEDKFLVEVDIPDDIPLPIAPSPLAELVTALVRQASEQLRDGGDLAFIGWDSDGVCELEIADSGCDVHHRKCEQPRVASLNGTELQWRNCPQGGASVTLCFPKSFVHRKAA